MITINLHLNLVWAIPVIVLPISLISFIASPSNFMFCRQDSAQHITSDGAERPFLSQKRQLKCHYALLSRIESNTDITLILRISSGALVPDIMHAKQASKLWTPKRWSPSHNSQSAVIAGFYSAEGGIDPRQCLYKRAQFDPWHIFFLKI